jgi:hypothetical protein
MSRRYALLLAAAVGGWPTFGAPQRLSYVGTGSADKLESKLDLGIANAGLALSADMRLIGETGQTKVLPRLTTSWTTLEFLDVKTVFVYQDLNAAAGPSRPSVSTDVLIRSEVPFLDRVEATLQRAQSTTRNALHVRFTELDTALELFGGRPLGIRTDVTVRDGPGRLETSSSVTSAWGLGPALNVQSVLKMDDDPHAGWQRSVLDTRLVYRSPVAFIERLEGQIRRNAGGGAQQSLAILLPELSAGIEHGTSFSVTGKALISELESVDGLETRTFGFETKFSGFLPPLLGGRNALRFTLERGLAADGPRTSSFAYDHAWSPGDASIGLNLKMLREADELAPSMDITWSTRF